MLDEVGDVDAVVSTAGRASFGSALDASDEDFELGIRSKLMGQVHLIQMASQRLSPSASITVTSGILGTSPGPGTAPVAMVNAGLEGFVRAAAKDLVEGPRVNVVSPPFVRETAMKMGMGAVGMPAAQVAESYVAVIEGGGSGATVFPAGTAAPR